MSISLAIIIPVYNGERFIEKAVNSISLQSLQPSEIIVVNDGSTDRTSEILKCLNLPNLKIVEQENTGVSRARNNGVKESCSNILAFMDVDDFWHSQKLEIQTNELNAGNFGLVYTDIVRISEAETNVPEHDLIADTELTETKLMPVKEIIYKPHLTTSSVMVKRDVFEAVGGFDESFKTAEDQVFYMDVVNEFKIGCVELPLTYKRYVKNSLSSGIETYHDSLKALDRFEQQHPHAARKYSGAIRKARARIYRDLGTEYLYERKISHALQPLLLSIKKYPTIGSFILLMKFFLLSIVGKKSDG